MALLLRLLLLLLPLVAFLAAQPQDWDSARPDPSDSPLFARWLVANALWGVVSTISIHLGGVPFGNIVSFSDGLPGNSTGTPYFYLTRLDPTARDVGRDSRCSFTISEASLGTCGTTDVENPTCSKITLSGKMVEIQEAAAMDFAAAALFAKHPEMQGWPKGHRFRFYKLRILDIFLIDFFGGPKPVTVADYYQASPPTVPAVPRASSKLQELE